MNNQKQSTTQQYVVSSQKLKRLIDNLRSSRLIKKEKTINEDQTTKLSKNSVRHLRMFGHAIY